MSSRRRRNLLRTLAILVALVVVLAGAGAVYGYRYADRLVAKGQRPVGRVTATARGSSQQNAHATRLLAGGMARRQ